MKKILIIILSILVVGCSSPDVSSTAQEEKVMYIRINANEARGILDKEENVVLLDVRTLGEFRERRIPGSILLPYDEISLYADEVLPDKDAIILIYCRSGRRSAVAALELIDMGYQRVYDFGGILEWPYETVSGE